jgi:hypothetical protein
MSPELEPFLDAVAAHVAFGLGADPSDGGTGERLTNARLAALGILRACGAVDGPGDARGLDDAARTLLGNPPLLAAFFQNLDLLYQHDAPGAPAVSLLLMRTMEL